MALATGVSQLPNLMRATVSYQQGALKERVAKTPEQVNEDITKLFDYYAAWATTWMKINAPWTDDTGAARSGLTAVSNSYRNIYEMVLAYSVQYGIWLEVANSGRFQILGPAMRIIGNNIMKALDGMLDGKPPNLSPPIAEIPPVARKTARKGTVNKSGNRRSRKAYGKKQQARRRGKP